MKLRLPDYTYKVKEVIRVIDGDTVDILIDVGFYMTVRKRIRMLDIDTDEVRGGTDETKLRARLAKDRLEELLAMGDVYIKTRMDATGKYGRLLGTLFVDPENVSINVNETLVKNGYEKGGTGTDFGTGIAQILIE